MVKFSGVYDAWSPSSPLETMGGGKSGNFFGRCAKPVEKAMGVEGREDTSRII